MLREVVMTNKNIHRVWTCNTLTGRQAASLLDLYGWNHGPDAGRPEGPPELRRRQDGGVTLSWDAPQLGVVAELPLNLTKGKTLAQIEGELVVLCDC